MGSQSALLTVGSTQFDELVQAGLSSDCLRALAGKHITRFIVQYGRGKDPSALFQPVPGVQVELHAFMNDIEERMKDVDLVISHAGVPTSSSAFCWSRFACSSQASTRRRRLHTSRPSRSSTVALDIAKAAHHRPKRHTDGCSSVRASRRDAGQRLGERRNAGVGENRLLSIACGELMEWLHSTLAKVIAALPSSPAMNATGPVFPPYDPLKIRNILDEQLGYL